jgi:pentatricopeptide repeat protein
MMEHVNTANDDARTIEPGWFSVRCVFQVNDESPFTYEERITLWRADSFEEAIALAEAEASEYARDTGLRYLDLAQAYQLADEVDHGAEVFSLMRDSGLQPDDYLDTFFETGTERQGTIGDHPVQP